MDLSKVFPTFSGPTTRRKAKPKLKGKSKQEIYTQFASFIEDGFTPYRTAEALAIEYGRDSRDKRGQFYRYMARQLKEGDEIAKALRGVVPETDLFVLESAEKTGLLAEGFNRLIYFNEQSGILKDKMLSLFKPLALAAAALGILYGFATGVLPGFTTMVPEDEWGGGTTSLIAMGEWLEIYTLPILAGITIYFVVSMAMLTRLTSPIRDKYLNRFFPPWSFYQIFTSNSFLLTLGTIMESGIRLNQALPMIKEYSGAYLANHIDRMEQSVKEGATDGAAVATDLFDKESKLLLRVFGRGNQFDKQVQKIAKRSMEAAMRRIDRIVEVANTTMKIAIAGIIIWIVSGIGGVVLPMISNMNFGA